MLSEETRNKLTTIAENEQKVYDNGVADGKRAEYDAFWDAYQNKGYYMPWGGYFFAYEGWTDENFFPKYDVVFQPGGNGAIFYQNAVTNLRERIDGRGLKMRFRASSGIPTFSMMYRFAKTTEVPDCDTSKVQNFVEAFQNATNLVTIPRLNVSNATNLNNTFGGASALENITFEGVIPISISFASSPLSVASLKSIVKHLKNYLGTSSEYAYTLTVKTSAWEALVSAGCTDEDFAWIEETFGISKSLWEEFGFTWTDIAGYLRWNLVLA